MKVRYGWMTAHDWGAVGIGETKVKEGFSKNLQVVRSASAAAGWKPGLKEVREEECHLAGVVRTYTGMRRDY